MELIIDHLSKRYGRDFALRELQRVKPPISSDCWAVSSFNIRRHRNLDHRSNASDGLYHVLSTDLLSIRIAMGKGNPHAGGTYGWKSCLLKHEGTGTIPGVR